MRVASVAAALRWVMRLGVDVNLQRVHAEKRLIGILNGCDYDTPAAEQPTSLELANLIDKELDDWAGTATADFRNCFLAARRCSKLRDLERNDGPIVVSIGRLTTQKLFLLVQEHNGHAVMSNLLEKLNPGFFIMLGSGDPYYEEFFTDTMAQHENFLFLKGYSDALSDALYSFGDLFIMPSIYEPCGISQMLAMRAGVPCLAHRVGGLNDTVTHGVNGFSFGGKSLTAKINELEMCFTAVCNCFLHKPDQFNKIANASANTHYTWEYSIAQYLQLLYEGD
jgi:starch synthase